MVRKIVLALTAVVLTFVAVLGGYVAYLTLTYDRIGDKVSLEVESNPLQTVQMGKSYTAVTYNVGYGAYTPDFTFFMDEGTLKDGTAIVGSHATCVSKESTLAATNGSAALLRTLNPDFALLQEVDVASDRSYQVNQKDFFQTAMSPCGSVFASNFHTAYLAYPLYDMIGVVNSGLLTNSKYAVESAVRRSYPVSDSIPDKFFDLDRCFEVLRLPVEGTSKQLVIINSHMSAYDKGGVIRQQQLQMITRVMTEETALGNWVILGGDWNHALCNSQELYASNEKVPSWVSILSESDLPEGFAVVRASNLETVATCRNNATPYVAGETYQVTVDGFIVSSNVVATAENIDNGYQFSDHNPVKLTFSLQG